MEYNNLREMGYEGLSALWEKTGSNFCSLDYVGLEYLVRVRYVGDRMPSGMVSKLMTTPQREWCASRQWKPSVTLLEFSYAYGWTRKGTLVRVRASEPGLPYQIVCMRRDLSDFSGQLDRACREAGKDPKSMKLAEAVSWLY